jgi:predicted nucleic acid-binding Zn ribbon protein
MKRADGPVPLGESLRQLAARYTEVDLLVMGDITNRWPALVGDALAQRSAPEVVRRGTLIVRAHNGAFAEAIRRDERRILEGLSDLGSKAPARLQVVVREGRERGL